MGFNRDGIPNSRKTANAYRAFLRAESRKVDKSCCISFMDKKYEVRVVYIGRSVDIAYDPADITTITVEDIVIGTSFIVSELTIGTHTGPRPKLPEHMTKRLLI